MTDIVAVGTTPNYMRQLGFFDPSKHKDAAVTFVGVGGIGSFAATAVAKLGVPHIRLIDPDYVDDHNLPNQMYDVADLGVSKVEAAAIAVREAAGVEARTYRSSIGTDGWQGDEIRGIGGIVVSGLDSMTARHDLWHKAVKLNPAVPLLIDCRLDAQIIHVYCVDPRNTEDVAKYEQLTLYSDDEADDNSCTTRAVIDVGFTVGAQVARAVRRHYARLPNGKLTIINQETNVITTAEEWWA